MIPPISKAAFVSQYVTAFLGAWAGNMHYHGNRHDWQRTVVTHPPVEDAIFQAEETWKRCCERQPEYFEWTVSNGEFV